MKFRKRLQRLLDDSLLEWRDKFIAYKRLKQSLKLIDPGVASNPLCFSQCGCDASDCGSTTSSPCTIILSNCSQEQLLSLFCRSLARAEADFIWLLKSELEKINSFFVEKEEDFVIRWPETKGKFEKLQETCGDNLELSQDIVEIRKEIVNIHGEMVLLENYSALNFTGLVKIIKKHDKKTGGLLRMPFIQGVLQEPFFTTDIITKLVQECEETLQLLFPLSSFNGRRASNSNEKPNSYDCRNPLPPYFEISEAFGGDDYVERICRNTMAAWQIMREFRKGSSTYNFFSIPPFGCGEYEERPCCKSAITEQLCWYPGIPVGSNL
eukprot:c25589_g1_i1 orf=594-1565(+)